jgi:multiple sugar transport system permease protein
MKVRNPIPVFDGGAASGTLPAAPRRTGLEQFRRSFRRNLPGYLCILPAVLFLFFLVLYPIVLTFQLSTNDVQQDLSLRWIGFGSYARLVGDAAFWNTVRVTAVFVVATVVLHLVIGMIFALLLHHEWPSRGLRNFVRGLLILPWLFSTAASALMWSLLLHPFGTFNYIARDWLGVAAPIEWLSRAPLALVSIILVNQWKSYPFYMVIILGGLQSIPTDLYEAAKVDGASFWQSFRGITLPLMRPVLVALSVIDIIGTFAAYDLIRMLTDGGPGRTTETVAYYLWKVAFTQGHLDYSSAISIVLLAMLAVFIGIYMKLVARGGQGDGTSF